MDLWKYYDGDLKYINLSSYIYSNEALNDKESRKEILKTRPEWAYKQAEALHDKFPEGEPAIAKHTKYSYLYATNILKGPFPLGEPVIAKDPYYAYGYSKYVLKNKFPEGESAIATKSDNSHYYAKFVLKGPFPLGEPAIAKDPYYSKKIYK